MKKFIEELKSYAKNGTTEKRGMFVLPHKPCDITVRVEGNRAYLGEELKNKIYTQEYIELLLKEVERVIKTPYEPECDVIEGIKIYKLDKGKRIYKDISIIGNTQDFLVFDNNYDLILSCVDNEILSSRLSKEDTERVKEVLRIYK